MKRHREALRSTLERRRRDERGYSAMTVVLLFTALLMMAGLVIDGGYAIGAKRQASNHAQQAARVGADALDQGSLRSGGNPVVNAGRARGAAQSYLSSVGATGSVSINGGRVTVNVTHRQRTSILSIAGIRGLNVRASATAVSIDENTS